MISLSKLLYSLHSLTLPSITHSVKNLQISLVPLKAEPEGTQELRKDCNTVTDKRDQEATVLSPIELLVYNMV